MSAPSALQLIDDIINKVEQLPAMVANASAACSKTAAAAGPASASASIIPTSTKDIRWWPIIPVGHTAYTWYGVADNPNDAALAATAPIGAASTPAAAAVPAPAAAAPAAKPAAAAQPNQDKEKKEKKEKQSAPKQAAKPAAAVAEDPSQPEFTKMDLRVGQIVKAQRHPNPEVTAMYMEEIDVGEGQPRIIVSKLVEYIPIEVFSTARVCVICNLKAGNLAGVVSNGMVLAASTGEGDARKVELLVPPAGAKPGDRLTLLDGDYSTYKPLDVVDGRKKNKKGELDNPWARVAQTFKVDDNGAAQWEGKQIGVKGLGPCTVAQIRNAHIG